MNSIEEYLSKNYVYKESVNLKGKILNFRMEVKKSDYHELFAIFYKFTDDKFEWLEEVSIDLSVEEAMKNSSVDKIHNYMHEVFLERLEYAVKVDNINLIRWGV